MSEGVIDLFELGLCDAIGRLLKEAAGVDFVVVRNPARIVSSYWEVCRLRGHDDAETMISLFLFNNVLAVHLYWIERETDSGPVYTMKQVVLELADPESVDQLSKLCGEHLQRWRERWSQR